MSRSTSAVSPVAARNGSAGVSPASSTHPLAPISHELAQSLCLFIPTIIALAWIFPAHHIWPLAFVCLTPWTVGICVTRRAWIVHWGSFIAGWGFFLWSLRWLYPVTDLGYVALAFYLAIYWVLAAWAIRTGRRHGISPVWTVPVAWVACEYLRAWVMTGFPWLFLAHGLYEQIWLIQISDVFGAYGVSFIAAMINGLIAELLLTFVWKSPTAGRRRSVVTGLIGAVVVVGGALSYGAYRLSQIDFAAEPARRGPRVAVIQEDFPLFSDGRPNTDVRIVLASYLALAAEAAQSNPDLIVFPESTWGAIQNHEFLALERRAVDDISPMAPIYGRQCDAAVGAFARGDYAAVNRIIDELDHRLKREAEASPKYYRYTPLPRLRPERGPAVPLVVGSLSVEVFPEAVYPKSAKYNSALIYDADGRQRAERYDKIHLVPFGEVVPFRNSDRLRWLYRWLNSLSPFSYGGKYEYSMTPGSAVHGFELPYDGRTIRFAIPICYEDVMPYVPRDMVWDGSTRKVDFLLNISNDGWFLHSNELPQHLAICVFRAVENRVSIARAVNTGISAFIDPNGRIRSRVEKDGRSFGVGIIGYDIEPVYIDSRHSLYGRFGDWFARLCLILAALLWLDGVIARWVHALRVRWVRWRVWLARRGKPA